MKTFVSVLAKVCLSMVLVVPSAIARQDEVAAPWLEASIQTGLAREKEDGISAEIRAEFDATQSDLKLWVFFADKAVFDEETYLANIDRLVTNYNPRAIERRRLRRTAPGLFDGFDLPVSPGYLEAVASTGARVGTSSRWLNAISVHASPAEAERIASLPSVQSIRLVRRGKRGPLPFLQKTSSTDQSPRGNFYGHSQVQLDQISLPTLHARGWTGQGVIIGVLDTGFRRDHQAFTSAERPLSVLAEWDFVNDDPNTGIEAGDDPDQHFHGTVILGSMGTYIPQEMVGAAYDASYVLAKVEDAAAEYPLEEDWFTAGLEFLEAEGCDVATSSLIAFWYEPDAMDGETSIMAQAFNVATSNGMHCCQAVGNDGHDSDPLTSRLRTPSDAFEVISCGAVDINDDIASFSSDGPTRDGRVKPEVLSRGKNAWTVDAYSTAGYVTVSGTSIATPQVAGAVACLVQAHPNWSVAVLRDRLFHTADYYLANDGYDPLYVLGYGIVDAAGADDTAVSVPIDGGIGEARFQSHPNPFRERTLISATLPATGRVVLELHDVRGRQILRVDHGIRASGSYELVFERHDLPAGVYVYHLLQNDVPVGRGSLRILR